MMGSDSLHACVAGISVESVRAQLQRIQASRTFSNAPALTRFLSFVVEHAIQGCANQLKEYTLGTEVFDRGDSFDPRLDTIVRVQARRLRAKLDEYYRLEGPDDPIAIDVPKGQYAAVVTGRVGRHPRIPSPPSMVQASSASCGPEIEHGRARPLPLPAARTSFIGREQELAAVTQCLLTPTVRLVTLTGTGGSGKTRLSLEVAAAVANQFPGGVHFIALAAITDPHEVASMIARSCGLVQKGDNPLPEILSEHLPFLLGASTLFVLDNFEQVLPAAPIIGELLEACSLLKVLVTSRVVLRIYGEHEYFVSPFNTPSPTALPALETLSRNPAVSLFIERALGVRPNFKLTTENARDVAEICSRLDGLPLAIELAAARVKVLSPSLILARLRTRLEVAAVGAIDLPLRHQTLRQTIDWSYELLSSPLRKLFRQVCVFVGGCTLESIEAVCNARRDLGIDVLDGMTSLLNHSLIQQLEAPHGEARFVTLETIREYGLERLELSGEEQATRQAHAAFCLILAEESYGRQAPDERAAWLALCQLEHPNMRAALAWLLDCHNSGWALRLSNALYKFYRFWERSEYLTEGRQSLEEILRLPGSAARTHDRAVAITHLACMQVVQGEYQSAKALCLEALEIYSELDDRIGAVGVANTLGALEMIQGNWPSARSWWEETLQTCRELGSRAEIAAVLSNLGRVISAEGEHDHARMLLQEAMALFRELGDWRDVGWSLDYLGDIAQAAGNDTEARRLYLDAARTFHEQGDKCGMAQSSYDLGYLSCKLNHQPDAQSYFEQSLRLFLELGYKGGVAKALEGLATLAAHVGRPQRALKLAGAAAAVRQTTGGCSRPGEQAKVDCALEKAWQSRDSGAAQADWLAGRNLTFHQAVEFAFSPDLG